MGRGSRYALTIAGVAELTQEEFERIYGRVAPLTLTQVRDLFEGSDLRWWICGGWSLEP